MFLMIENRNITIRELYKKYLYPRFNIDVLLEYIDKYDINMLYNREEFLLLYYKLLPFKISEMIQRKLRRDYKIAMSLSNHFLARLLMRFSNEKAIDICDEINNMYRNAQYTILNKNTIYEKDYILRIVGNKFNLALQPFDNTLISIYKKS